MKILIFGEVLWDVYPDKSVIGGAPFNFAAHSARNNAKADIVTAVGKDEIGSETLRIINKMGVSDKYVSVTEFPTGACFVSVDENGIPKYDLRFNMAYDHISVTNEQLDKINNEGYDAFYFGTLALRHDDSRKALQAITDSCNFKYVFFDINIRQSWYDRETVENGLKICNVFKISREECNVLSELELLSCKKADYTEKNDYYKAICKEIAEKYSIELVLFTLDKDGSVVYSAENDCFTFSEKPKGKAVSTVGAGDSFSAGFICSLINGDSIEKAIFKATVLSSFVVQNIEAIPDYPKELSDILKS